MQTPPPLNLGKKRLYLLYLNAISHHPHLCNKAPPLLLLLRIDYSCRHYPQLPKKLRCHSSSTYHRASKPALTLFGQARIANLPPRIRKAARPGKAHTKDICMS
jgi:hypothetical protein